MTTMIGIDVKMVLPLSLVIVSILASEIPLVSLLVEKNTKKASKTVHVWKVVPTAVHVTTGIAMQPRPQPRPLQQPQLLQLPQLQQQVPPQQKLRQLPQQRPPQQIQLSIQQFLFSLPILHHIQNPPKSIQMAI